MDFKQHMQNGERQQITVLGDFLYVEIASGQVLVTTESGGYYELGRGAQVKSDRLTGRVTLENKGEAGLISIKTGFGEYVEPQRDQIAVSTLPDIAIAPGQKVAVSAMPSMTIEPGQKVAVSAMPSMTLAPDQKVAVSAMPSMTLAPGQQVAVNALPNVKLAAGQQLGVTELPDVTLAAGQSISVKSGALFNASEQVLPFSLAEDITRRKVMIKAHPDNVEPLIIAGVWPLAAGESIELETTATIELTGAATDKACILEVSL